MIKSIPQPLFATDAPIGAPVITNLVQTETPQQQIVAEVRRAPAKPDAPEGLFPLFKESTLEDSANWIGTHITGYSETYDDRTANVPRKLMNLTLRNKSDLIFPGAQYSVETFCLKQQDRLIKGAKGELDGTPYRAQFMWFRVTQPNGFLDCRYFKYNKAGFLVVEVRKITATNVLNATVASTSALLGAENKVDPTESGDEQVDLPKAPTQEPAETPSEQAPLPKKGSVQPTI